MKSNQESKKLTKNQKRLAVVVLIVFVISVAIAIYKSPSSKELDAKQIKEYVEAHDQYPLQEIFIPLKNDSLRKDSRGFLIKPGNWYLYQDNNFYYIAETPKELMQDQGKFPPIYLLEDTGWLNELSLHTYHFNDRGQLSGTVYE